jgi:hypothetical protein
LWVKVFDPIFVAERPSVAARQVTVADSSPGELRVITVDGAPKIFLSGGLESGCNIAIENGTFIVDFPIKNGDIP